jgi:hypothetical protein
MQTALFLSPPPLGAGRRRHLRLARVLQLAATPRVEPSPIRVPTHRPLTPRTDPRRHEPKPRTRWGGELRRCRFAVVVRVARESFPAPPRGSRETPPPAPSPTWPRVTRRPLHRPRAHRRRLAQLRGRRGARHPRRPPLARAGREGPSARAALHLAASGATTPVLCPVRLLRRRRCRRRHRRSKRLEMNGR